MATDLKGLKNFRRRLEKYDIGANFSDIVADEIANVGVEYAKEQYGNKKVTVDKEIVGDGKIKVFSQGKSVPYIEYGTGHIGKGTYKGDLPTQPLTFESPKGRGDIHTTQGWEYYYPNSKTKVNGGWYLTNKVFTRGRVAGNQMFNTAEMLRKQIKTIIKKKFGKGVK